MAEWVWEARGSNGEVRRGIMEAESEDLVRDRLRAQKLNPVQIKKKPREFNISFGTGVTEKDLVVFIRQLSTMIDAGLPLVQALDLLASQTDNKALQKILFDVKEHVERGGTFSEALGRHPALFDDLFVNLVAAGEAGGILDTILQRLAVYIEKRAKLKRQVRGALVYPTAILFVALAVLAVMLVWVIPAFEGMFADFGGKDNLPGLTRFVIGVSNAVVENLFFIVLAIAGVVAAVVASYRNPKGKRVWHRMLLTVPILGPVMRKIAVARFTRTLGTLLASGVPILDALQIVSKASGNVIVEEAIVKVGEKIREGRTMAEPLMEAKVFPPMVVQMIGVGEQTGAVDQMLNKIADFYEDEVDVAVAALTSLLEPLMMVFIGGLVGFILIAMYLPIFTMAGNISAG